ncbi:cytochrome c oxidase subunit II [Erythrobacter sp.]|uniref:cytochrome c oxidase subunit II n=1 Tax=Erythrobacter sp. TaxID=1042 RepID=UPI002E98A220|nr:cytochrome c oxidase subunit II [Erythrobacter sp.]
MKFGMFALIAAMLALLMPQMTIAQDEAPSDSDLEMVQRGVLGEAPPTAMPREVIAGETEPPAPSGAYTPMEPTPGKGMPTSFEEDAAKSMTFQDQYSVDGEYALWMHDTILLPIITAISLLVLGLLLYAVVRFNRRSNPVPSKTTHNTLIEVIWTIVPVIILVVIAVPSITLLARQYENPPEDAITVKAVGYQWYWGYEYPDHDVEVISNMLSDADAIANGEPAQLAVDNRMVVPAGVPIRLQTTAADVIHSFAVPSLWFKQDAVPGRLNERMLVIEEPGVYYGQCSELCGSRHAYMPIAVEALPMDAFNEWVRSQGGTVPGEEELEDNEIVPAAEARPDDLDAEETVAGEPAT